ncbi:ethanolamine ammonia-lyase subunit EutC [Methyloceanibacter sp.]|uniref:ethanolamine ammonia-lyase subunit EutC n=1 Tax=Methyloceanibacter sp. TaxID=1965321 RepID=UPI002D68A062|nr:ethanolamine ammonia-lyase subunit EutC [Methyloceanibacter sp.]HZP09639.1 ethanolamine ammonia-lyase subunit EutC [Methyloceanibacter sp.]
MARGPRDIVVADPWTKLRDYTSARIALGRAGTSLPTKPHLEFQLAHARARDAVHRELDAEAFAETLRARGLETVVLHSAAEGRPMYLQRPDKGRRLDAASRKRLEELQRPQKPYDVAFVIGDGLSAFAIEENAAAFLDAVLPTLKDDWNIAPLSVVKEARVAIGDEIGEVLGAKMVVILIGERPGLSSPDSLGIYMTLGPRIGLTDEARNCISNVRPQGLGYKEAAYKLRYLMTEARRRGISGVNLKDEAEALPKTGPGSAENFLIES